MFELDKYEPGLHNEPPAVPAQPYEPAADVKEMSLLFWGEHCVECAAPSCYQTCDLYQARPDKRCRRFVYGSFKNKRFASIRGYGVEVSFKKWAKIEAFGNLALHPVRSVLARERLVQWAAPLANAFGKLAGKITGNTNWDSGTYIATERWTRRLHRGRSENHLPDSFLLEVYNPGSDLVRLQLNFTLAKDETTNADDLVRLGPSFVTTLSLPNGYSRHEVDAVHFHPVIASGKPFKISMVPEGDSRARLVFLTADFVGFAKRAVTTAPQKIKCLVWDLDNTLWNGILVEGDNVTIRREIARLLKELDERGILLSIASKNDYASAWQKLQQLGLADYFLYPQINWAPKSMSIKFIAERLNIGLDSFAFVDDSPFELEQVSRALPGISCINARDITSLFADPRFQGSTSSDARRRRRFYQEAMTREMAQQEFGSNYLAFLATCGIRLEVSAYSPEDASRVAELVQRTNQLNFSGHKYTRSQLDEVLADPELEKYVLRSSDKYGSCGTVGFSIVERRPGIVHVRDFMLSCRVQGKFIEQAFFHHLVAHHNPDAAAILVVNFRPTDRNKPAQQVLETLGFRKCDSSRDGLPDGMAHSALDSLACGFIEVQCLAPTNANHLSSNCTPRQW
jgi:FkbH-like protein